MTGTESAYSVIEFGLSVVIVVGPFTKAEA